MLHSKIILPLKISHLSLENEYFARTLAESMYIHCITIHANI